MKCKVCGKHFRLKKENKYEATQANPLMAIVKPGVVSEAFDCPKCGCQNIVNERLYPPYEAKKTEGEA